MSELTAKGLAMIAAAPKPDDRRGVRDASGQYVQYKPAVRHPLPTLSPAPPVGAGGPIAAEAAPATGQVLTMTAAAKYAFDRYGIAEERAKIAIQKGEVEGAHRKLQGVGWEVPAEALDTWCKAETTPKEA